MTAASAVTPRPPDRARQTAPARPRSPQSHCTRMTAASAVTPRVHDRGFRSHTASARPSLTAVTPRVHDRDLPDVVADAPAGGVEALDVGGTLLAADLRRAGLT